MFGCRCCRDPGRTLTYINSFRFTILFFGLGWLLFAISISSEWFQKIITTITINDREAKIETGIMAACIGNLVQTFIIWTANLRQIRYKVTYVTTPRNPPSPHSDPMEMSDEMADVVDGGGLDTDDSADRHNTCCHPGRMLTWIYSWRISLIVLGVFWTFFSAVISGLWFHDIITTITVNDQYAKIEAGIMAACLGNLVQSFAITCIVIRLYKFHLVVYAKYRVSNDEKIFKQSLSKIDSIGGDGERRGGGGDEDSASSSSHHHHDSSTCGSSNFSTIGSSTTVPYDPQIQRDQNTTTAVQIEPLQDHRISEGE